MQSSNGPQVRQSFSLISDNRTRQLDKAIYNYHDDEDQYQYVHIGNIPM